MFLFCYCLDAKAVFYILNVNEKSPGTKVAYFHLATREEFSIILNVILLISPSVYDKFNNVLEKKYIATSGIMSFHQSRVNVDCLPGNF